MNELAGGGRTPPWTVATAIVRMELLLRLREPAFLVLLAFLLAGCALLVPDPAAGYAIVTIDHKKPRLSSDTALVAAGIVLAALLLPVYSLALDIGHARDRKTLVDRLQLTSPVGRLVLPWARLIASFLFVLFTLLVSLVVISSTIVARYGGLPGPDATMLFLLIVAPVGMAAALLGAVLDRFLPERSIAKAALAFSAWMGALTLPLLVSRDLLAIGYINQAAMPGEPERAFAVGVIAAREMPSILWQTTPFLEPFVWSRLVLVALLLATTTAFALLLGPGLNVAPPSGDVAPTATAPARAWPGRPARSEAVTPATASALVTVGAMVGGWMNRSPYVWAAIAISLLLALLAGHAPGASLAVALTVPVTILSKTSAGEVQVAATLERTTAALWRPAPALMYGWVLALLAVAPTLPGLVRMRPVQAATAVSGVLASALWLTWTHRCVRRPLLGTAIFVTFWYFAVFNDLPSALDLFGLWHESATALLITLLLAGTMLSLVGLSERRGGAETREVER